MSLVDFLSRLHQNDGSNNHVTSAQRIREAIIIILQKQRLFGEVLLQLPRENDLQLPAMMGLRWEDNRLVLVINPEKLANVRNDELQSLLEHEALHLIWMHPLRYASYPHQDLVQIATDVAVNQYLTEPPQGTVTLSQLEKALRQKLMPKLDSQDYLNILEQLPAEQQEKLHQPGLKLNGGKQEENATADEVKIADTHNGWQESKTSQQISNQVVRLANIKQILNRSWRQTPQRDRGLLPGNVRSQLQKVQKTKIVDWRQVFRHQFGLIARGQVNSHARFNRRQPLRMDLPGKVTRLDPAVDIFVDNSGSVTDQEIVQTLTILEKMLKKTKLTANVYSFDARVTTKQKLHDGKKLDFRRTGGGGTSFQCIFDYLHQHHLTKRNRIIIITDGWGEERINDYHYQNVYWLMMTKANQLSVKEPPGRVLEMRG